MKKRSQFSTYCKILSLYIQGANQQFKLQINSSTTLSVYEKRLLKVRTYFLIQQWDKAQELLFITNPNELFLQAEKHFLLATTYFHLSRIEMSAIHNRKSFELFKQLQDHQGAFNSGHNLSVDYSRLGMDVISRHILDEIMPYANSPTQETLVARAKACLLSKSGNIDEAISILYPLIFNFNKELNTSDIELLSVAVEIFYKANYFEELLSIFSFLIKKKSNWEKNRIRFEFHALEFLLYDKSFPSDCPIDNCESEYYHYWKVVSKLLCGDHVTAEEHWSQLQKQFPARYDKAYTAKYEEDQQRIFFKVIDKIQVTISSSQFEIYLDLCRGKKMKMMLEVLYKANAPVTKCEMVEKIWRVDYKKDYDQRLYKLAQRLRNELGIQLLTTNQTYQLPPQ